MLLSSSPPHQSRSTVECSWEYDYPRDQSSAQSAFATAIPPGYKPTNDSSRALAYSKFDGHDTFSISYGFALATSTSTRVTVTFRAEPD